MESTVTTAVSHGVQQRVGAVDCALELRGKNSLTARLLYKRVHRALLSCEVSRYLIVDDLDGEAIEHVDAEWALDQGSRDAEALLMLTNCDSEAAIATTQIVLSGRSELAVSIIARKAGRIGPHALSGLAIAWRSLGEPRRALEVYKYLSDFSRGEIRVIALVNAFILAESQGQRVISRQVRRRLKAEPVLEGLAVDNVMRFARRRLDCGYSLGEIGRDDERFVEILSKRRVEAV